MKVAFFDTKPYDVPGFDHYAAGAGLEIKYFETRLNADSGVLNIGGKEPVFPVPAMSNRFSGIRL